MNSEIAWFNKRRKTQRVSKSKIKKTNRKQPITVEYRVLENP